MVPNMQNYVAIGLRVSAPQYAILPSLWVTSFCSFWGFFNKATAYTLERIFKKNWSNDVVSGKEVLFGGFDDYIFYLDP